MQVNFRMPAELKARLEQAAKGNHRSVTAELVARLEASLSPDVASFLSPELRSRVEESAKFSKRSITDEIVSLIEAAYWFTEDSYEVAENDDIDDSVAFEPPPDDNEPLWDDILKRMALADLSNRVVQTASRLAAVESQLQQVIELLQKR